MNKYEFPALNTETADDLAEHIRKMDERLQAAKVKIKDLDRKVAYEDRLIDDCLHYLELNMLSAPEVVRVSVAMRDARRRRRMLIDEYANLKQVANFMSQKGPTLTDKVDSAVHKSITRINGDRHYKTKTIPLKDILSGEYINGNQSSNQ